MAVVAVSVGASHDDSPVVSSSDGGKSSGSQESLHYWLFRKKIKNYYKLESPTALNNLFKFT